MSFSQEVFQKNRDIIEAIIEGSFVRELASGNLDKKIFDYYISQDIAYLYRFAQAAALCAAKASECDLPFFVEMQKAALEETELINRHYANAPGFARASGQTPACLHYSAFILQLAASAPIETAFAGLYPCPWLYMYIGQKFGQSVAEGHPYRHWLVSNGNPEYPKIIQSYDHLLNRYAEQNPALAPSMHEAARAAFFHEYYFWRDAHSLDSFYKL